MIASQLRLHPLCVCRLSVDFSIQVLSSGSWPFQQSCTFALPSEVRRSQTVNDHGGGPSVSVWTSSHSTSPPYFSFSLSLCVAGAELPALHGVLRQQTQRQEAHLALPPVQRRAGDQLLQEQVVAVKLTSSQVETQHSRHTERKHTRTHTHTIAVIWTVLLYVVAFRYTLQASTFQMAILLQYNTEDSYTVQQLTDSTQIKIVSAQR